MERLIEKARSVQGAYRMNEWFVAGAVGAALLTENDNIYTGISIELACGIGFCAEHSAAAEMLKHRETRIKAVVAVTDEKIIPPCGRCRELMLQINEENSETQVFISEDKRVPLKELLPYRWYER